ncbi:allantoate deiminase [Gudongella sp. SC589]|jgi:allantoate deiminase|uniref:allantoate deiminase n=1 Tax=Gudongella sp. SC589 TaxID=3385990 RepID=UPI0039048AD8
MVIDSFNSKELETLIEDLSEYGGADGKGITRLLFDNSWIAAQNWLRGKFSEKGLQTYYDVSGNLYGRLEGNQIDSIILTGSHIDTVVSGGKLDGQYGIIAGMMALEYLKTKYGTPKKTLEVVSMAEEEGSRFPFTFWGSKNIVGTVSEEEMSEIHDANGISFKEALKKAGFDFKKKSDEKNIEAFIELHVEQGGVLEIEKKSIGVVHHIVGQNRYIVTVSGEANHAGTTPMGYRRDSLNGAARMICEIMDKAREFGDPLVATAGKLELVPNTSNVVPGKATFTLDIRHIDKNIMGKYIDEIMAMMKRISKEMNLELEVEKYMDGEPVQMDKNLVEVIRNQCEEKGMNFRMMHSGAGHDAQVMALKVPTALIFVPSHKGISHNPEEYTELSDLVEGVKILIETLYKLAY